MNSTENVSRIDQDTGYEIKVKGHLTERWSDWFEGMAISTQRDGSTILCGSIADQAALFGLLNKIHALNLTLISVMLTQE